MKRFFCLCFFEIALIFNIYAGGSPKENISLVFVGDGGFVKKNSFTGKIQSLAAKRLPGKSLILSFPYQHINGMNIDWMLLGFVNSRLMSYNQYPAADRCIFILNIRDGGPWKTAKQNALTNFISNVLYYYRNSYVVIVQRENQRGATEEKMLSAAAALFDIPTIRLQSPSEEELADKLTGLLQTSMPEPDRGNPFSGGNLHPYDISSYDARGWIDWQLSPIDWFTSVLKCYRPNSDLKCRFRGTAFGILAVSTPDSADVLVSVDGGAFVRKEIPATAHPSIFPALLAENLPRGEHEIRVRMPDDAGSGKNILIGQIYIKGQPIWAKNTMSPLEYIDSVFDAMPKLKYRPAGDGSTKLPKTGKALSGHLPLTIVMLGDSIINDTASSDFHLLLERDYKCKVNVIKSVRGGCSIGWFCQNDRMKNYVLKYNPTLVIIGGISTPSPEDYRAAVRYIRKYSDADILLLSKTFGGIILNRGEGKKAVDLGVALQKIAEEEGVAYFPMHIPYRKYIEDSGMIVQSLMRDPCHHNDRGKQLLGRLLYSWIRADIEQTKP